MSDYSASERLARAVADDLNARSSRFSVSFTAKYDPMPNYELSDLQLMRLNVRDTGQRSLGRGTRGQTNYEYAVQVITQVKIGDSLSTVMARLKSLAEQISDFFMFIRPTGCDETIDRVEVAEFGTDSDLEQQGLARFTMTMVFFGNRAAPTDA